MRIQCYTTYRTREDQARPSVNRPTSEKVRTVNARSTASIPAPRPARFPSSLDRAMSSGKWPVYIPADDCWLVESSTRPELDHVVQVFLDGTMSCTCEAGQHGQPDCLHRAGVAWCIRANIRGAYHTCANGNCGTRVSKAGMLCIGCANMTAACAGQAASERKPLPFPTERAQQAPAVKAPRREKVTCCRCGGNASDPLHDTYC